MNRLPPLRATILPEWIDYNGHMNVAYYVLLFDRATDAAMDALGLDAAYRQRVRCSVFVGEMHVCYEREMDQDAVAEITTRVLDVNETRAVLFHEMMSVGPDAGPDAGQDGRVACNEVLCVHVDLDRRRSAPWPAAALAALRSLAAATADAPLPKGAGRAIGLRRR